MKSFIAYLAEQPSRSEQLRDALSRVLDRMGTKNETLEDAVEAVYPDYGGMDFRTSLRAYAQGKSINEEVVHHWSDADTLPKPGTQAPYAVCNMNPTNKSKFTLKRNEVTCKHCLRLLGLHEYLDEETKVKDGVTYYKLLVPSGPYKGRYVWSSSANIVVGGIRKSDLIDEAFNSKLNWNVMPGAVVKKSGPVGIPQSTLRAAGVPDGEVVYHKDIGLPDEFEKPRPGMLLKYGFHAAHQAEEKGIPLPARLPENFTIIEVSMIKYRVIKWVIRFQATLLWDIVMVVMPDGFVKTTWPNAHTDLHSTLNRSKYADKPNF